MSAAAKSSLVEFARFIQHQLGQGETSLSPDAAMARWRDQSETIAAVHKGLEAVELGRTKPLDANVADFERRHALADGR